MSAEPPRRSTLARGLEWGALTLLFVLAALAGFREFVTGKLSPFFGDIRYTHYPLIRAGAPRDGHWPLWSDHIFNGYPLFADSQAAAYYPATWLVRAWGPDAFTAVIIVHVVIAGLGMVAWLRGHELRLPAQLTGALAFAFSGAFLSLAVHLGLFCVLAWVPAWLAAVHRVARTPSIAGVALAAALLCAMLFAGGPQMLAAALLLTGIYVLALLVQARRRGRPLLERTLGLLAVVVVGAGLGAIALLPQLEFIPLSQRSIGLELELAAKPRLAPHALWRLFVNPFVPRPEGPICDPLELYVGTLTAVLALVALLTALRREHRREHAVLSGTMAALALLTITATLSDTLPVFRALVEWVPGMGYFRAPSRLSALTELALAFLAALGLDMWLRGQVTRRSVAIAVALAIVTPLLASVWSPTFDGEGPAALSLLAVAIGLAALLFGERRRAEVGAMIVAVTVVDLAFLAAPHTPFAQRSREEPPSATELEGRGLQALDYIAELEPDPLAARVMILEGYGYGSYNHTILRGLDGVSGYNGSSLLRFLDVMHLIRAGSFYPRTGLYQDEIALKPARLDSPAVEMLGAPFVVRPTGLNSRNYEFLTRLYADGRSERVYRIRRAVPRAYTSTRTIVAPSLAEREQALQRFDPWRETIVEDPRLQLDGSPNIAAAHIRRPQPEHLIVECEVDEPALLVVTDAHYPGWIARVDGTPTPIAIVNHVFRGIPLEAGAHVVELEFRPRSYAIGWRVSLATLAVLAFAGAFALSRRRAAK